MIIVYGQQCSDPICKVDWTFDELPHLSDQDGLCGQNCSQSLVCDPCKIISSQKGKVVAIILCIPKEERKTKQTKNKHTNN